MFISSGHYCNYLEVFMFFKMPLSPEAQCVTKQLLFVNRKPRARTQPRGSVLRDTAMTQLGEDPSGFVFANLSTWSKCL